MTNETSDIGREDAEAALDSVDLLSQESLRRALPPRWFAPAISLMVGLMHVFRSSDELRGYNVLLIVFIAIAITRLSQYQNRSGVSPRAFPLGAVSVVGTIVVGAVLIALYFGGIVLTQSGLGWAPYATGAAAAILILLVSESNRGHQAIGA